MIQEQGQVKFLKHHDKAVKGVSFNPRERYIFTSCSSDGTINIYGSYGKIITYPLMNREINNVEFSQDGRKILAALSKKFVILDVETGQPLRVYDDCCSYSSMNRTPIATDKLSPFIAITSYINGKGISIYDIRMPLPFEFLCDLTTSEIRDICFLNGSWPFVCQHPGLATLTCDGVVKITTIDGKLLHSFEVNHKANSLTTTPEQYKPIHSSSSSFRSSILVGGEYLSSYSPESSSYDKVLSRLNFPPTSINSHNLNSNPSSSFVFHDFYFNQVHNLSVNLSNSVSSSALNALTLSTSISANSLSNNPTNTNSSNQLTNNRRNNLIKTINLPSSITKLKYGTNGGLLYAATSNSIINFRRFPNEHRLIGDLFSHKSEINDFDISPYDEFIVTASKDKTVGIYCLGSPNHGTTSISALT